MANNIGQCITQRIASEHFAKVLVPAGGLKAGQVVLCTSLAASIPNVSNNLEIYTATKPLTANLDSGFFALVINGGFETLADGRRPAGQPDYTQYEYAEGEIADVIFLDRHLVFEIGVGNVSGATTATPSSDIGKFLIPANDTNILAVSASAGAGSCMKIIAVSNFRTGGLYGGGFVPTYICVGQ